MQQSSRPIKPKILTVCPFTDKAIDRGSLIASAFQAQEFVLLDLEEAIKDYKFLLPYLRDEASFKAVKMLLRYLSQITDAVED